MSQSIHEHLENEIRCETYISKFDEDARHIEKVPAFAMIFQQWDMMMFGSLVGHSFITSNCRNQLNKAHMMSMI